MFLAPDRVYTISAGGLERKVNERIIPDSAKATKYVASYVKMGDPIKPCAKLSGTGQPKGVTIHNTGDINVAAGTNAAEQYSRATWPNCNMAGVVVHFYVWHDIIWQNLAESEQGWHAGDGKARRDAHRDGQIIGGNLDTIAIECIGADDATEETAAILTAHLLQKHNLDLLDVYTHNFFMGLADRIVSGASKNCPIYILPHWSGFLSRVHELHSPGAAPEPDELTALRQRIVQLEHDLDVAKKDLAEAREKADKYDALTAELQTFVGKYA